MIHVANKQIVCELDMYSSKDKHFNDRTGNDRTTRATKLATAVWAESGLDSLRCSDEGFQQQCQNQNKHLAGRERLLFLHQSPSGQKQKPQRGTDNVRRGASAYK